MPLPPEVDEKIRKRFDELIMEAQSLAANMPVIIYERYGKAYEPAYKKEFISLQIKAVRLLEIIESGSQSIKNLKFEVSNLINDKAGADHMIGVLEGVKNNYENGMLDSLTEMIEANIAGDYMTQAEQLLGEGVPGQYDHVPAAVLAGAILEKSLRTLCERQDPPIDILKPNGDAKTMNTLINDLRVIDFYTELKAKQLRAWADIRNAAAHGKFDKFNREDVEDMIKGINRFLAEYM